MAGNIRANAVSWLKSTRISIASNQEKSPDVETSGLLVFGMISVSCKDIVLFRIDNFLRVVFSKKQSLNYLISFF